MTFENVIARYLLVFAYFKGIICSQSSFSASAVNLIEEKQNDNFANLSEGELWWSKYNSE